MTGLGMYFHDLRHAGNIWAAQTKVSTRDLMARMGHDDLRAALICQRATQEAADRIADGLTDQVEWHRRRGHGRRRAPTTGLPTRWFRRAEGTQRARGESGSRNDGGPGSAVVT